MDSSKPSPAPSPKPGTNPPASPPSPPSPASKSEGSFLPGPSQGPGSPNIGSINDMSLSTLVAALSSSPQLLDAIFSTEAFKEKVEEKFREMREREGGEEEEVICTGLSWVWLI